MAGNFNRVFLMGNLTRDVELKSTQSGQSVANIGLAVNRRWRGQDGEQREETTYIDCEAWGATAETMAKYLAKGRPVFIEGRLKYETWEDKEGKKHSRLRVVVEGFQFIDSRPGGGGEGGGRPPQRQGGGRPQQSESRQAAAPTEEVGADDIPF